MGYRKRIVAALLASVVAAPIAAGSQYVNVKAMLIEAIDVPDGGVRGEITGDIAEKFWATTGTMAPVTAEVTTVSRFRQEGCSRLNVRLSQADVPVQGGGRAPLEVSYVVNICRDGSPPVEGMDLEKVGKALRSSAMQD